MSHPEYQIVRHKQGGTVFEVMTKPGALLRWRKGEIPKTDLDAVLFTDVLFKNASKGDRHSAEEITATYGCDNVLSAIAKILEKGDLQMTAAERKEKVDKKRREIVNFVHNNYVNPQTKTCHPVTRIDAALDEIKFRVDPDIPAERQAADALKKLVDVIMLKKSEIRGILRVPHSVLGQVQGVIHKYCEVGREKYDSDGLVAEVSLVPGDYDGMIAEVTRVSKGAVTFDIEGAEQAGASEDSQGGKKGKGGKGGKGKGKKK